MNNCNCIFVTKNVDIPIVVKNLYWKTRFKNNEINFAITDIDLTAMLWLSTFGDKNDLPQLMLLENAYAASRPSDKVLKAFFDKINRLEEDGTLSNERAILLRTNYSMQEELVSLVNNDESEINSDTIINLNKKMIHQVEESLLNGSLKKEKDYIIQQHEEISSTREDIESKTQMLRLQEINLEQAFHSLDVLNKKINRDRKINDEKSIEINQGRAKLKREKQEYQEKIQRNAEKEANKNKKIFKTRFKIIARILIMFVCVGYYYVNRTFVDKYNINSIINFVITLVLFVPTIIGLWKFMLNRINFHSERIYENTYSNYVESFK